MAKAGVGCQSSGGVSPPLRKPAAPSHCDLCGRLRKIGSAPLYLPLSRFAGCQGVVWVVSQRSHPDFASLAGSFVWYIFLWQNDWLSAQLIAGRQFIMGWPSGTSMDSQDTLAFSVLTGVRSINQVFLLERLCLLACHQRLSRPCVGHSILTRVDGGGARSRVRSKVWSMQTAEEVPIYIHTVSTLTGIPARRIRRCI